MKKVLIFLALFLFFGTIHLVVFQDIHKKAKKAAEPPTLRVLTVDPVKDDSFSFDALHRVEMPIDRANALLRSFARQQGMKLEFVRTDSFSELFTMLQAGRGDLISANLTTTAWRRKNFLLSEPFTYTREIVFTAEKSPVKATLAGVVGSILPGTTYEENFRKLSAQNPQIKWTPIEKTITHEELMDAVENGTFAYSALNECDIDARLAYRPGLRKLFPLRSDVPLVFAVRKNSAQLHLALNRFISEITQDSDIPEPVEKIQITSKTPPKNKPAAVRPATPGRKTASPFLFSSGDLEQIKKRGYIRMLTSNDVFCCYLHQGRMQGLEFDLASRLAKQLNVALITVIPPNFKDLIPYLEAGKGDFIAAHVTRTGERLRTHSNLSFCTPYLGVTQVLVGRSGEKISGLNDLKGRNICIRAGTSYHDTLKKMQSAGGKFNIILHQEEESELQTLRKVASGQIDLTVVDDIYLKYAVNAGCPVKKLMALSGQEPFCWIVRKKSPHLASAINQFFRKENKSAFFNSCVRRYYGIQHVKKMKPVFFRDREMMISPYDALFRKYGKMYQFNWYFLAAQSFQESGFKANAVNHIGATGLMQMMPATAREIGIRNLKNPENGIHAGTKYMAKIRAKLPENMTPDNKLCFSLASYNAGYGHVLDARKLAKQKGWDPDIWFKNTERALALLEENRYASRARFGFCRASETIPYVRNIMLQSYHYQKLMDSQQKKKQSGASAEKKTGK